MPFLDSRISFSVEVFAVVVHIDKKTKTAHEIVATRTLFKRKPHNNIISYCGVKKIKASG